MSQNLWATIMPFGPLAGPHFRHCEGVPISYQQLLLNPEFLKFVGPIGPRWQKIMRSANNVGNAGPHVRQTFLNDVFTFLTEVATSSVNSEFVTVLNA